MQIQGCVAPKDLLSPLHPPAFGPMPEVLPLDVALWMLKTFSFQESFHIKPDTPEAVGAWGGLGERFL